MAASVGSVSIDLDAKIAKFESDIGRAARLLEKEMARAASMAERVMQRASKEISAEMDRIAKRAEAFGKQLIGYFAVTSLVDYARGLAAVADSFSNIQAKVKLATGGQIDLAKATEDVYGVAQRTYGSFEATAALVQRTAGSLRNAGRGYQEAFSTGIQLAEVFNKALVVSGASTSEAISSAQQFSQALASGKFQGDEFRSVMENNSRFAKLLADSLGITISQLREMSTAGKLNVESMLGVLKNTAALDAEFAKMPVTIGRATQQLSNTWTKFIGESDQAAGASRKVAAAIQAVGENLPQIVGALVTLGEVAVTVFGLKMAGAIAQAGKALVITTGQAITAEAVWRSMAIATTEAAVATNFASTAMAGLAATGRTLLAFLGGIPGLLIAAAAGLVYFATRSTDVSEEIDRLEKKAAELEKRALSLGDAFKLLATGAEPAKKSLLEIKQAQLDELEAARERVGFNGEILKSFQANGFALVSVRHEIDALRKAEAEVNLANIKAEFSDIVRVIGGAVQAVINWRETWKSALQRSVSADPDLAKEAEQMEKRAMQLGKTKAQYYELIKAKELDTVATKANAKEGSEAYKILEEAVAKKYERILAAAKAEDAAAASIKASKQEIRDKAKEENAAEKATNNYAKAMDSLSEYTNAYTKDLGERSKVESQHIKRLDDIKEKEEKAIASAKGMANAKQLESDARKQAKMALDSESKAYAANLKELEKQKNIAGPILKGLQDRVSDAFLDDRTLSGVQAVRQLHQAYEALSDELKADVLPRMGEMTEAVREQALATYDAEKSAQFWRNTWESAVGDVADVFAQFATGQIKSAKDLGKALQDVFKQTFQKIIAEMIRSGIMKMFASFFGGGSGGGGGFWGTLFAGAAAYLGGSGSSGGGGGGSVNMSQNTSNGGIDLTNQQTGGFSYGGGGGTNWGGMLGTAAVNQGASYVMGTSGTGGPFATAFGQFANSGAGSAAAAAAPWAGALAGAWYGSTRGDGGIGTATGIAAGAIAGYYAGVVAAGAITGAAAASAAGTSVAAGAAGTYATATAAGSGAAGAISAIPIIGWVAAIVLAIDAISGGKALGTKYRPNTLQTDISFGPDGPDASASLTEWKYRRNIFQFNRGGSLEAMRRFGERQYQARDIEVDPELMAALKKVADDLDKTATKAAEFLHTEVIDALDASFSTLQVFDKKGRVKRTETVGTILGKEYRESWEKFQIRMHAETIIATVGQLDAMASKIAEAYRKDADVLIDAAATMLQAQRDIGKGDSLLGSGGTLESTFAWLEKHRVGDEKLIETYARLMQATQQYNDILDKVEEGFEQLTKGSSAVDQLKEALKQIGKNMEDNIEALNAAAVAAGLTAASERDLARIRELAAAQIDKISADFFASIEDQIAAFTHLATPAGDFASAMEAIAASMRENEQMAHMLARAQGRSGASAAELARIYDLGARQMAAAIRKLEDIGRQQARSLGYLGLETIDDYDARIEELEGKAKAAADAVGGFGSAMSDVAQSATDAMNLLLGNLSPLNDQQKLQVALGGLSAGTATPEQVLEIGRRLYASTQQYTDLFNQVMSYGRRTAGGGNGRGGSGEDRPKPLTSAEQAELVRLRLERDEKIKQQRFAEATEFANTIASLAAAQGISFQDVADNIGFDLADLGKDLGLSMDDLLKYLDGIDVQQNVIPDSITSNFDRLLAALDKYWGNGTGYYQGAEPPEDGQITPEGRRARTGRNMRPASIGDPMPEGTNDREGSVRRGNVDPAIIAMDNYSRSVNAAGERNTRTIADATDRNTAAVNDMARDFREGFGNNPRGTRWNNEVMN